MICKIAYLLGIAFFSAVAVFAQENQFPNDSLSNQTARSIGRDLQKEQRKNLDSANLSTEIFGDPRNGRQLLGQPYSTGQTIQAPKLTLDELINAVDLYHPKLRGADAERKIASAKRLEKQGAFDPIFITGTDYLRYNTELDNKTLRGKTANARIADAGVELLTRSGIKIGGGARFNLGKIKSPFSPTGDGGEYFLDFKIPLMRNRGINEKLAAERQAILGEPLADAEFQATRLDLLQKAAVSYWDWVSAKQKLDVARNLLRLAEFRAGAVRDRVNAGDLPQIDVVEADTEVRRRQGVVVKADRDLQKASFKLSLFLWTPSGSPSPVPQEANAPATIAPPISLTSDSAEVGMRMALDRRPELRAITLNQNITQVDLDLARNQRQPAVDLSFSPGRDTGLGAIGATLKASLSFTFPLRQRTADGRIAAATLKQQKLNLDLVNERQRITTEVLDAISAINTTVDRYRAAAQEVELSERLEQGERDKFALGDSTLFLVNQRERAAAEARVKLIETQAEYEQAIANFRAVTAQF